MRLLVLLVKEYKKEKIWLLYESHHIVKTENEWSQSQIKDLHVFSFNSHAKLQSSFINRSVKKGCHISSTFQLINIIHTQQKASTSLLIISHTKMNLNSTEAHIYICLSTSVGVLTDVESINTSIFYIS